MNKREWEESKNSTASAVSWDKKGEKLLPRMELPSKGKLLPNRKIHVEKHYVIHVRPQPADISDLLRSSQAEV